MLPNVGVSFVSVDTSAGQSGYLILIGCLYGRCDVHLHVDCNQPGFAAMLSNGRPAKHRALMAGPSCDRMEKCTKSASSFSSDSEENTGVVES